jgi:hypothetical protein
MISLLTAVVIPPLTIFIWVRESLNPAWTYTDAGSTSQTFTRHSWVCQIRHEQDGYDFDNDCRIAVSTESAF